MSEKKPSGLKHLIRIKTPFIWVKPPDHVGFGLMDLVGAANKGDTEAQIHLGLLYACGQTVQQDFPKADEYFKLAAEKGDFRAIYNLGVLYYAVGSTWLRPAE